MEPAGFRIQRSTTPLTESSTQHAIHARLMQYGIGIDNPLTIFLAAIP